LRTLRDRTLIAWSTVRPHSTVATLLCGDLQGGVPIKLLYQGGERYVPEFAFLVSPRGPAIDQQLLFRGSLASYLLSARRLEDHSDPADVVVRQAGLGWRPAPDEFAYVPFLDGRLRLASTLADQIGQVRSKTHRRRLRAVLRSGEYQWTVGRDAADFELFYDRLYAPYVLGRFGARVHLDGRDELARLHAKAGRTLLVRKGADPVCGALLLQPRRGGVLVYHRSGFLGGDRWPATLLAGRTAALELAVLDYGVRAGFRLLDLGFTRALLNDGLFVHKRRLGCFFVAASYSPTFFVRVRPEARPRVFAALPLLGMEEGGFVAHLGYERTAPPCPSRRWRRVVKNYSLPGLRRVILHTDAPAEDAGLAFFESALRHALGPVPLDLAGPVAPLQSG